jgi:Uma2 family endonuclease
MRSMRKRIDDYLKFGVPNVWIVDPADRRAWTYSFEGNREVKDGVLRTENPSIEVSLAEVFAGLNDAGA